MKDYSLTEDELHRAGLGVFFRPHQLSDLGIGYHRFRRLVAQGTIERIARGLYRLSSAEVTERYSVAAVCARVPRSIVCLLSALQVYEIGTRLPKEVWLAIPHKARAPRLPDMRIRLLRFSGASWSYGIKDIEFEGVPARITSPERTIVDCFRYERLIGRETAIEAYKEAFRSKKITVDGIYRTLETLPSRRLRMVLEATGI
jgi:predicted transcriptional regulator of viral defense system